MGILRAIVSIVLVLVVAGALLYVVDYGVDATITDKGQDAQGNYVVATTKIGNVQQKQYLPLQQWTLVQKGFFVVYHIQSGHTAVYDREGGRLIYQS